MNDVQQLIADMDEARGETPGLTARRVLAVTTELRKRAEVAHPGPWWSSKTWGGVIGPIVDAEQAEHQGRLYESPQDSGLPSGYLIAESLISPNQSYLTLWSPDTGIALAGLLEWHAQEAPGRLPAALAALVTTLEAAIAMNGGPA